MNATQVMVLLEANQNERGIQNWQRTRAPDDKLNSFGIGLTVLRKLGKQIGRDHDLAQQLWESDVYDAQIIALLINDPKQMTREQVEVQVENVEHGGSPMCSVPAMPPSPRRPSSLNSRAIG